MKKRKIASLYMLMAMTISACGNQTPQADLAEMQENDTITADAEGQTEYEEAAAEKEGSSEDNSIVEVSNSENNIVEITDYIGNFEKVVEIMDMEYDNEAATGSNNYCIDNFKLSWDDYGYYAVSNQENEKVALYGVRIGDNRAAVLSRIQEYGYTYQSVSEDSDTIYLLQDGKIIYIEIFYNGEQVTSWYVNNYEEGEIEDIKNILELKEQYNIKTSEAWKSAYIDFVFEKYMNDDFLLDEPLQKYKLVNVNGDNIPELYINFGSTAGGDMLCSYFDNSVIYQPMWNYGFSYIEGGNLFLDSGGHMDEYYDIVYSIEDGSFVVQAEGECGAEDNANIQFDAEGFPIYNYYWNGNQVSGEAEYEELLNKAFDKGRAKKPFENDDIYDYQEIVNQIIQY